MRRLKDRSGERYGRLTAIRRAPNRGKRTMWWCLCDCGESATIRGEDLQSGRSKSCGCIRKEVTGKLKLSHGLGRHPLYATYQSMIRRCDPAKASASEKRYYADRGIKVCTLWRFSMVHFFHYCESNGWQPGLEIDRIDNDGNYEPGNVRFVDHKTNMNNTRRTKCHRL